MKLTHGNVTGDPVNVLEFEALARDWMEPSAYDYFAGAAGDERHARREPGPPASFRVVPYFPSMP